MKKDTRQQFEMGIRARDFSTANPSADPSYAGLVSRLDADITRIRDLSAQQRNGLVEVRKSTAHREELRDTLHDGLQHLVTVALAASVEEPELAKGFKLPRQSTNQERLITAARTMTDDGRAKQDLFLRHGMDSRLLDDLDQTLKAYEEAVAQSNAGRRAHVGASAELEQVAADIMVVVDLLDSLNRYRFRTNAEQMAAWESASNVFGPEKKKAGGAGVANEPVPAEGSEGPPENGKSDRAAA
jgi:hypothetical protein